MRLKYLLLPLRYIVAHFEAEGISQKILEEASRLKMLPEEKSMILEAYKKAKRLLGKN